MAKRRGFGVKPPREKPEYKEAPEVGEAAKKLIEKFHTHLREARIMFMFRTGKWEQRGMTILGKAEKVSEKWKFLTEFDFVIVINRAAWFENKPEIRDAILDHELTHCARGLDDKQGNPKWYIQPHMVEDFPSIISRHGLWTSSLQRLVEAKDKFEQLSIDSLPATGTDGK